MVWTIQLGCSLLGQLLIYSDAIFFLGGQIMPWGCIACRFHVIFKEPPLLARHYLGYGLVHIAILFRCAAHLDRGRNIDFLLYAGLAEFPFLKACWEG